MYFRLPSQNFLLLVQECSPPTCVKAVVNHLVYLMVDQVEDLRRRKVKTSFSDLAKPLLAGETSLCTDRLLFCAPEALALLSTARAHCFYICRRRFCLICPQEHSVAGKS